MIFSYVQIFSWKIHEYTYSINKYYWNYDVHTTCLCLSEALSWVFRIFLPQAALASLA